MKKALPFLLVLVLLFAGCGVDDSVQDTDNPEDAQEAEDIQGTDTPDDAAEDPVFSDGEGEIGDFYVAIKGAEMGVDYADEPCIIVTYEWTNNGNDATAFLYELSAIAYQNGIECETAMMVDGVDSSDSLKSIKPGVTMELKVAYELADTDSDVEIEVMESFSFADEKPVVTKFFELPV